MKKIFKIVAIVLVTICSFGLFARITTNAHLFESKKKADTEQEHELQWVEVDHLEVGKKYKWKEYEDMRVAPDSQIMPGSPMFSANMYKDDGSTFYGDRVAVVLSEGTGPISVSFMANWENPISIGGRDDSGYKYIVFDELPFESCTQYPAIIDFFLNNLLEQA